MPVEIREITIRTDISANGKNPPSAAREKELQLLKKQLLEECRRMVSLNAKRAGYKR